MGWNWWFFFCGTILRKIPQKWDDNFHSPLPTGKMCCFNPSQIYQWSPWGPILPTKGDKNYVLVQPPTTSSSVTETHYWRYPWYTCCKPPTRNLNCSHKIQGIPEISLHFRWLNHDKSPPSFSPNNHQSTPKCSGAMPAEMHRDCTPNGANIDNKTRRLLSRASIGGLGRLTWLFVCWAWDMGPTFLLP